LQQLSLLKRDVADFRDFRPQEPPSLAGVSRIAMDTEGTGLRWFSGDRPVGVSVCLPDGETRYLPFGHVGGNLPEERVVDWLKQEVRGKHIDFFNAPYDVNSIFVGLGVDLEAQGCTFSDAGHWAALLDDHRYQSSLESISQEYLGYGKKPGPDLTDGAQHYHAAELEEYACGDARLVHDLRLKLWPMLDAEELQRVRQLEDDCIPATCEMMRNGAPLDEELLDKWLVQSERDYVKCLYGLRELLGFKVNPASTNDLRLIFDKCGLPYPTKDEPGPDYGKVTFAKGYIEDIDHPVLRLVRRARRLTSFRSKYLIPYKADVKKNGVLRYALHQMRAGGDDDETGDSGTISGRYSSSAYSTGDGANIQQVAGKKFQHSVAEEGEGWPYDIRKLFIPESGLWGSFDMEQVEYRLFVAYAKSQRLLEIYAKDPHTNFHKVTQAMIEQYRPITYSLTKDVNFAGLFGAGLTKFAFMLRMTEAQARPLYQTYHSALPEARALHKKAMKVAERRGFVRTKTGRRARFPDKKFCHAAVNRVIQGTAADALKLKLAELHKVSRSLGFKMRFTIHDEINGDASNSEAIQEVGKFLDRQILELEVPLLWKAGSGPNWAEAK